MPFGEGRPRDADVVRVRAPSDLRAALAAGARAVLTADAPDALVLAAHVAVTAGLVAIDPRLVAGLTDVAPIDDLTAREREVLALLVDGASNKRIGRALGISEHTAKFHVNQILVKLGVRTRTEAAVVAVRRGLLVV